jgi:hypothetical protein
MADQAERVLNGSDSRFDRLDETNGPEPPPSARSEGDRTREVTRSFLILSPNTQHANQLIPGMNGRTRDPLTLSAVLGCWAVWAGNVLFIVQGFGPAYRSWIESGNAEMAYYNLSSALFLLSLPTLVAVCAIGMLGGSAVWAGVWAGVTSFLLVIQLLLTLGFWILVSSPEAPARYGFASALVWGVLLVVVGSAFIQLIRAERPR